MILTPCDEGFIIKCLIYRRNIRCLICIICCNLLASRISTIQRDGGVAVVKKQLKVGVIVPFQGPAGIWAESCLTSALLAAAEINMQGGMNGRQLELVIRDSGNSAYSAAAAASESVDVEGAEALVSMVPSSARQSIRDAVDLEIPFIYTPQFEGCGGPQATMMIGDTASQLLRPAIDWLAHEKKATRFFLLGNDYMWPRKSIAQARHLVGNWGGHVVGEQEIRFGVTQYEGLLKRIARARPHVVISWLLGNEAISFNRAFASSGLAAKILRLSMAVDETVLYGIGADATENLYACSSYFANIRSRNNDAFLEKYHQSFGASPPPQNAFGQSMYEGLHCLNALAAGADSLHSSSLFRRIGKVPQRKTARGFDGNVAVGARHPVYIAKAEGHAFKILLSR